MKTGSFLYTMFLMLAVMAVLLSACAQSQPSQSPETTTTTTATTTNAPETPRQLRFTGKVLELDEDSVLMECYDKDKFDTVWVYVGALSIAPAVGEEYIVSYEDMVMPSLPPRITAVTMEKK